MTESTSEYKKRIEEIKQSIENEPYMAKMREDIAEGISKTGIRQATVEEQFQAVLDETTGKDVISAPELIAARNGELNLKTRLDKEKQEVTAQLQQTEQSLNAQLAHKATKGEIGLTDLDKNKTQFDETWLSDGLKQQIAGNAPVNAAPPDGGVTTAKLAEKSVTLSKTSFAEVNLNEFSWINESISIANGSTAISTTQISSSFFRIAKGTQFSRQTGANCYLHVYDKSFNFLASYAASLHKEVPIDGYYGRLSLFYSDNRDVTAPSDLISYIRLQNFKFNDADEMIKDKSIYQLSKWKTGGVNTTNGSYLPNQTRISSEYIKGKSGVKLEIKIPDASFYVVLFDQKNNYIKGSSYTKSTTVTDDFYSMRITIKYDDNRLINEAQLGILVSGLNYYNYSFLPNWVIPYAESENVLINKTLLNFGDSIASAETEGVDGYHEIIANKNKMNLVNYARNGATVKVKDGSTNDLKTQIESAISTNVQPDYILFDGLRNDVSDDVSTIGEITPTYNDILDTSTFCGAFEYYCKIMRENWLGAKIIYIRTHNTYVVGAKQITLGELTLEICRKWAIPFVDIYSEGGLNTQFPAMRGVYTLSETDGTHPNTLGYETFYVPPIEAKMKSV